MAEDNTGDRLATPPSHGSEAGVRIMRQSIKELSVRHGISETDLVAALAKQEAQLLTSALEYPFQSEPIPAVAHRMSEWRENLLKNPDSILDHRQAMLESSYKRWVSNLSKWLSGSTEALSMLDIPHIELLEREWELSSHGSLVERATRIADSLQICSPLIGGFAAEASSFTRMIRLYHGIPDCMSLGSSLICGTAIHDDGKGKLRIEQMRKNPKKCQWALAKLRELIELATGKRLSARVSAKISHRQALVAHYLAEGAQMFVVFHELAHFLLPPLNDPRDEEHACDAFATHLLVASRDQKMICGLYMGFYLMSAILHQAFAHSKSDTHPSISDRFDRVANLVETNGMELTHDWDALLSIPTRLMEEEVFESETFLTIYDRSYKHLQLTVGDILEPESCHSIALAVAAMARLPTLSEMPEPTLQLDNGRPIRIVTFDLISAMKILEELVRLPRAGTLLLQCLTAVADHSPPTRDAMIVFEAVMGTKNSSGRRIKQLAMNPVKQVDVDEALSSLTRLGCVLVQNKRARVAKQATMRMPTRPAGSSQTP